MRACQIFYARGPPGSAGPPNVNLGPPNISESKKKSYKVEIKNAIRDSNILASGLKKFPLGGVQGGSGPPNVNLGPPKISETTRPRMVKLKTELDIVKYSLWVQKFLR